MELQIELIEQWKSPTVLACRSMVGAVGRTLSTLAALRGRGWRPKAVVLIGPPDHWAEAEIRKHWPEGLVVGLRPPDGETWTPDAIRRAASSQSDQLDAIHDALSTPTPTDAAWIALDREVVWHPYTSLRDPDPPLPVIGAEAEFLHLADGRRLIDGISSWWTILHGHRHPPLVKALTDAIQEIDHVQFAGVTHPWAVKLAAELLATLDWTGGRVVYSDNGSTAVEIALKLAYQFWRHRGEPGRTTFIGFEHGYHGDTFGAMSVSRDPLFFGAFEPLLFRAEILPLDAGRLSEYLSKHRGEVAGVIVEPLVQGAGGMRMHTESELRELFKVARSHDVLFIADEVMTGLGRTGTFWAHQAAGIMPDLIASAKTLAGGMLPLAATLASSRIVEAFDTDDRRRTFFHGHSFTAHPLACAVALANLPLVKAALPELPRRFEAFWRDSLGDLADRPDVREVRIRGTIAAVEFAGEAGYLADIGRTIRDRSIQSGVVLRPLGNVVYAMPPWGTSTESLRKVALSLRERYAQTR